MNFSPSSLFCWQLLNGLFVLRVAIKGLHGLCEDEEQFVAGLEGTKRFENLIRAVSHNVISLEEK